MQQSIREKRDRKDSPHSIEILHIIEQTDIEVLILPV
jgi:hypothetical protein